MDPQGGVTIVPINYDLDISADYSFCCGFGYNTTSNLCSNGNTPLVIGANAVINNRTSGSTLANTTITTSPITTITATISSSGTKANASPSSKNLAAVGAGVGVPLGLAFLAALAVLLRERRDKKILKEKISTLEYDLLLVKERDSKTDGSLGAGRIGELPEFTRVNELHESDIQELSAR